MIVNLNEDEIKIILQSIGACNIGVLQPDAIKMIKLVQVLVKKLQPKQVSNNKKKRK